MRKHLLTLLVVLLFVLAVTATAQAQGVSPQHSASTWQAAYWNNMTLSGTPAVQRSEAQLDFNWGGGSPAPGVIGADQFSARWTRYLDLAAGTYRFSATSDDGMRVWVDNALIINDWSDHGARTVTAERYLSGGHRLVTVEYYENRLDAVARLSWTPVTNIQNWRGEYFNNTALAGSPALVRDDAQIQFDWGLGSPAPGTVNNDGFSVRWTRSLHFEPGDYLFQTTADDGVRLWVNGHLLVDAWQVQAARAFSGNLYLPGGTAELKMEYFEQSGRAVARLSWQKAGASAPAPPAPGPAPSGSVVVDDTSAGFVIGGSPSSWRYQAEGYNGRLLWTKNNDWVRPRYNWARWYPNLGVGRYEVFVYVPDRFTTTAAARYWVSHRDGLTLRIVNQSAYGGQWVSLGTYRFQGNSSDYVSLSDVTYEPYISRLIAFDAVRWDPR
ncbi:MAG: PA14 domain-containing protein [Candidatus Promineifilaceae bacterium]|nr:PA14 domain-containing protein [Candidatus Promineifilaceae bacterium]